MIMMNRHLIPFMLFVLLLCFACSQEDEQVPQPATQTEARYEVMVVFAPGQLGDKGYADDVMEAINLLTYKTENAKSDSLDINFISPWGFTSMQESIVNWASNAENPYEEGTYERRLLVLTESFMMSALGQLTNKLRPTDEVLVMKVNEDDVLSAAEKYGLGNRLHGLNISAANSIRRYCRFMDQYTMLIKDFAEQEVNPNLVSFFRLYDQQEVPYRDSIYETLTEELPDSVRITVTPLSNLQNEGLYITESGTTVIELSYIYAGFAQVALKLNGATFNIIDLGSGNAGWDYFCMGRSTDDFTFHTLVIDGNDMPMTSRCYVKRLFGLALINWNMEWLDNSVGGMPRMTCHCNDDFCTDNIPDMSDLLEDTDSIPDFGE